MKKGFLKILIILILKVGLASIFSGISLGYDLKEYFPLDEGNIWQYRKSEDKEITKETIKIEGAEIVKEVKTIKMVNVGEGEYFCLAFDSEGVKMYKDFDGDVSIIYEPPKLIFSNLKIGESKEYKTNWVEFNNKTLQKKAEGIIRGKVKLENIEDVKISAGVFKNCLKFSILSEEKENNGSYDRSDCTSWLAPGIGKVKEFCIITEYDSETGEKETYIEMRTLISAVIRGRKIGLR